MNIIMPILGCGSRFQEEKYSLPKPLIRVFSKPILYWCLKNLNVSNEDTIYIIYRKEFDDFSFTNNLKHNFRKYNFKFLGINHDTRGAAETVLYAVNSMSDEEKCEKVLIIDPDSFYKDDVINISKKHEDNLIFYFNDFNDKAIYSYINIQDNKVFEIKEKEKISHHACVGVYGFKNSKVLLDGIENIITENKKQKNEFYISSIYQYLLKDNQTITPIEITDFTNLGTPRAVQSFASNLSSEKNKYRFCFDLDNTLVTYPLIEGDYSSVEPIQKNIDYLNFLHQLGHTIIIHTARRMKTHGGNVGKVQADISKVTIETIEKFKIKYDELYFGKPYADFYIDDLSVKAYDNLEKEIGIYQTHPEPRSFNKIEIHDDFVYKFSEKIDGERYFYNNIPNCIKNKFPTLLDCGNDYIKISKINGVPISFIYSNKILTEEIFYKILSSLEDIHKSQSCNSFDFYLNYNKKLKSRIKDFDFSTFYNFHEISKNVIMVLDDYEKNNKGICGVIHGDPVFSNILIDNNDNIKFIDMRGKIGDEYTIFGDIFYDFAKIYQSIIGYDFILMSKDIDTNYINKFKFLFETYIINKFDLTQMNYIKAITNSLLLSLIPLHQDKDKIKKYYNLIKI